jgi:hypothetical protein
MLASGHSIGKRASMVYRDRGAVCDAIGYLARQGALEVDRTLTRFLLPADKDLDIYWTGFP